MIKKRRSFIRMRGGRIEWAWPKRCGCGRIHSEKEWRALPWVGVEPEMELEFRNCACGSTLAVRYVAAPTISTG